jgi:hypothetical protein
MLLIGGACMRYCTYLLPSLCGLLLVLVTTASAKPVGTATSSDSFPPRVFSLDKLSGLLRVTDVVESLDGGTLSVQLADSSGQKDRVRFNYHMLTPFQGRLFDETWGDSSIALIPLGSREEGKVFEAISQYLNQQFSSAQQARLAQNTLTVAHQEFGASGFYAYRLLHAMTYLRGLSRTPAS